MKTAKTIFHIEKTRTGFSAFSDDFPIFTTGKSMPQLLSNLEEAIVLYFEDVPRKKFVYQIQFTDFFLQYRILNAKILAQRIGLHPTLLSQYIRGVKPLSTEQGLRIVLGIQQIGRELSGLRFG
jgi:predicted RNase H-like HicB family nuclease